MSKSANTARRSLKDARPYSVNRSVPLSAATRWISYRNENLNLSIYDIDIGHRHINAGYRHRTWTYTGMDIDIGHRHMPAYTDARHIPAYIYSSIMYEGYVLVHVRRVRTRTAAALELGKGIDTRTRGI